MSSHIPKAPLPSGFFFFLEQFDTTAYALLILISTS